MTGPGNQFPDGVAIVYCEGTFDSPYGKTAHGLVRFTRRYEVTAVIDSHLAGRDAAEFLDGTAKGIPLVAGLADAIDATDAQGQRPTHFVIGLAPDGGMLGASTRAAVMEAIDAGLSVDSGLHEFLSDNEEIRALAGAKGVTLRDVRKPPPRSRLHFFCGKIQQVDSTVVAMLGTDSAIGKRTTAWLLVQALESAGIGAEMVGTGQTAWMQGVRYGMLLDSVVNDFVAGEIEHAVWSAWSQQRPRVIVVEGQGSLMHPAYPGGFEILGAARPDAVILQHAPGRREYDGFEGFPLHPIERQIQAIELISGRPVVAVTLNHEGLDATGIKTARTQIATTTGLVVVDPLRDGAEPLIATLRPFLRA